MQAAGDVEPLRIRGRRPRLAAGVLDNTLPLPQVLLLLRLVIRKRAKDVVHEGALFRQVASLLFVGLIIFQVLGAVADIPVAADDHIGRAAIRILARRVLRQHLLEFIQEAVLFIQLRRTGIAGGQVQGGDANIAGGSRNPAAGVGKGAEAHFDVGKRGARQDADAGAALCGGVGKS